MSECCCGLYEILWAAKEKAEQTATLQELTTNLARENKDAAQQIAALTAHVDLMLDEFVRISTCPGVTDEIKGLCIRGQQGIEQTVPVIVQRDKALKENEKLTAENKRLRETKEMLATEIQGLHHKIDSYERALRGGGEG